MTPAILLLAFVTLERLAELVLARRNTRALLAQGAVEHAPGHYPLIVVMHALWLAGLWVFGASQPVSPFWFGVFVLLQAGRLRSRGHPALDAEGDPARGDQPAERKADRESRIVTVPVHRGALRGSAAG